MKWGRRIYKKRRNCMHKMRTGFEEAASSKCSPSLPYTCVGISKGPENDRLGSTRPPLSRGLEDFDTGEGTTLKAYEKSRKAPRTVKFGLAEIVDVEREHFSTFSRTVRRRYEAKMFQRLDYRLTSTRLIGMNFKLALRSE